MTTRSHGLPLSVTRTTDGRWLRGTMTAALHTVHAHVVLSSCRTSCPGVSGMVLHVRWSVYAVATRARAKAAAQARARVGPDAGPARVDGT